VKRYNRRLRDLIHADRATPSLIISHHLHVGAAPDAYRHFDAREEGWRKVVLEPARVRAAPEIRQRRCSMPLTRR